MTFCTPIIETKNSANIRSVYNCDLDQHMTVFPFRADLKAGCYPFRLEIDEERKSTHHYLALYPRVHLTLVIDPKPPLLDPVGYIERALLARLWRQFVVFEYRRGTY